MGVGGANKINYLESSSSQTFMATESLENGS